MPKRKRKSIVKELDSVFSQYVRRRDSNLDGYVECATCGTCKPVKQMQNGHFQSRGKYPTRWHEHNTGPQCVGCNMFKQGEQYKMSKYLDEKYGEGTADKMVRLSNTTAKFSDADLLEMIEHYKELLNDLI